MTVMRTDEFYLGSVGQQVIDPNTEYDWPLLRLLTGEQVATLRLAGRDASLLTRQLDAAPRLQQLLALLDGGES